MSTIQAMRFLVTGTVQGVCFRASTRKQALVLGLRGHARNLIDGRVEVVAAGSADAVAALGEWLQHGPPQARVERVDARVIAGDGVVEGFSIG